MVGDNLANFLKKIENHVRAEEVILDAWNEKDEKYQQDVDAALANPVEALKNKKASKL